LPWKNPPCWMSSHPFAKILSNVNQLPLQLVFLWDFSAIN
jgi:hypothetical protein